MAFLGIKRWRVAPRQREHETRAALRPIFRVNFPAMRFDDGPANGQSQTDAPGRAFRLPRSNFLKMASSFPSAGRGRCRQPRPRSSFPQPWHHFDVAARRRVFRRIFQQIVHDPLHQHGVYFNRRQIFIGQTLLRCSAGARPAFSARCRQLPPAAAIVGSTPPGLMQLAISSRLLTWLLMRSASSFSDWAMRPARRWAPAA